MRGDQDALQARDERISQDKLCKYKGTARVQLSNLVFPHSTRQVDIKVIEQLKRDFDGEGCIRGEPSHRIPAIIDDLTLETNLERLNLNTEDFKKRASNPPSFHLGRNVMLECLHGKHRVLAAQDYLSPSQRWWIVDLYGTGKCCRSKLYHR